MSKLRPKGSHLQKPIVMASLFIIFVIIPGIVLSLIGLRSLSRENAFLEKQLTTALLIEMKPVVLSLEKELREIRDDLETLFDSTAMENSDPLSNNLISFRFKLSSKGDIVTPMFKSELTDEQHRFFRFNRDFFQDRVPVAQYKRVKISSKKAYSKYDKGRDQRKIVSRKKAPSKSEYKEQIRYEVKTQESLRFSQIIKEKPDGMILREIDGELMLLFYSKNSKDEIIGAVISLEEVQKRLFPLLPEERDAQRIIVLTDQNNKQLTADSLFKEAESEAVVELSLGAYLPIWHLTAYLTDPTMIDQQAQLNGTIIGLMIALLMISLTTGGIVIIRTIVVQLREAEQKTTFVANVSHELKTPLTSIRLFAELLQQERQPDPEKKKRYLTIMVSESERLTRLINNVLDFSRRNRGEKQYHKRNINLTELLSELTDNQRIRLEHRKFTVITEFPAEDVNICLDPEAIKQVLLNLISNAEKYSMNEKWIRLFMKTDEKTVLIGVEDHGIGIDPGLRRKVFQEFYRADTSLTSSVPGTGLGLTISSRIIADHGGKISCTEGSAGGSLFTITLPTEDNNA